METGKTIGNVNYLDLHKATDEAAARISRVCNANYVFFSRQTAHLLTQIRFDNVNHTIELPEDATIQQIMGQMIIRRDHFKGTASPVYPIVMGQVIVEAGIPVEEVEKNLAGMALMGQLICPESLAGVFLHKAVITGNTETYPPLDKVEFNSLKMDEGYLSALPDATELAVIGTLSLPDVLPNPLVEQKLSKLYVSGTVTCHAENAQALQSRFVQSPGSLKVIPAGFKLVDKAITLDKGNLGYLPSNKLYCTGQVQIAADVTATQLDQALSKLVCEGVVICPEALRSALTTKCDLFETKSIFYEGELWLVENEDKLQASRFEYLDGKATLVVYGSLIVEAGVDPKTLYERLAKVHNFGSIACATGEQVAAIQARLGTNDGEIGDLSQPEDDEGEKEEKDESSTNYNFLAL